MSILNMSIDMLYSIRKISMTKKPILKMGKNFFDFNAYRIRMLCNINIPPLLYNIIYKSSLLSTYIYMNYFG